MLAVPTTCPPTTQILRLMRRMTRKPDILIDGKELEWERGMALHVNKANLDALREKVRAAGCDGADPGDIQCRGIPLVENQNVPDDEVWRVFPNRIAEKLRIDNGQLR